MNIYETMDALKEGTTNSVYPILIDQYLCGKEAEIDLVADGKQICIPTIAEHIEKAGVHSGDSMAYLPAQALSPSVKEKMVSYAESIVTHLNYKGLMNIQYVLSGDDVYVLEVNPRASRTIPIISKVADVPLVQIATKILLGKYFLSDLTEKTGLLEDMNYTVVKYPVFSMFALSGLDSKLGPEMKSTGEGIAIGNTKEEALAKTFEFIGRNIKQNGNEVFISKSITLDKSLLERMKESGLSITDETNIDKFLKNKLGKVVLSNSDDEKIERMQAGKYRLFTFSHIDTFEAYVAATYIKKMSVTSLEEWHEKRRKGVTVT